MPGTSLIMSWLLLSTAGQTAGAVGHQAPRAATTLVKASSGGAAVRAPDAVERDTAPAPGAPRAAGPRREDGFERANAAAGATGSRAGGARSLRAPRDPGKVLVAAARTFAGTPYDFGGRRRDDDDGIDCLGLVLASFERLTGCGWKSFPWNPTEIVEQRVFGARLRGADPVVSEQFDVDALRAGDVLMLVAPDENVREPSIGELEGDKQWVWHVGLYTEQGKWIVGDHFAGEAVETDLRQYLTDHADTYRGVFVVRPPPKAGPKRCRKHAWMQPPKR